MKFLNIFFLILILSFASCSNPNPTDHQYSEETQLERPIPSKVSKKAKKRPQKSSSKAFEFTDNNFVEELSKNEVVVVDFWAVWCGPCRKISPIIEKLAKNYEGKALIGKVNVDHHPDISVEYGIRNIPTILIFKNGELLEKHVGTISQSKLEAKIKEALAG